MAQVNEPYEMPVVLAPARKTETFVVTAYTAGAESTGKSPGDPAYGITASGEKVAEGVTAACPPSMAFGTRIDIEGVGERVCTDRGGAIKSGRLDVYMPKLADAIQFGRQRLEVEILEAK
jgi:3D (Asp-Asp-Asp) domain-containing protein